MTAKSTIKAPATLEEATKALHMAEGVLGKALTAKTKSEAKQKVDQVKLGQDIKNSLKVILDCLDNKTEFNAKAAQKQAVIIKKAAEKALKVCERLLKEIS